MHFPGPSMPTAGLSDPLARPGGRPPAAASIAPADIHRLPPELLQLIAKRLAPADYVHFRNASQRLYQALQDPVSRHSMVERTVRKAAAYRRELTAVSRDKACGAVLQTIDFLAGAWALLHQQRVEPQAGVRLWEKTRDLLDSLAHTSSDARRELVEQNQLLIASLQALAALLPSRLDSMVLQGVHEASLALARQAMRRAAPPLRAALLDRLMDLLPLMPENRSTDYNRHGLELMARQLYPADQAKALVRLRAMAPRVPTIDDAALLHLTGSHDAGSSHPTSPA